jgi:hypothetical protein
MQVSILVVGTSLDLIFEYNNSPMNVENINNPHKAAVVITNPNACL